MTLSCARIVDCYIASKSHPSLWRARYLQALGGSLTHCWSSGLRGGPRLISRRWCSFEFVGSLDPLADCAITCGAGLLTRGCGWSGN
jgi:hypothetical protein